MQITLTRPPRDDDELWELVRALWGVTFPRQSVCDGHEAPFKVFSDAFWARAPQILLHGSRGFSGKSLMAAVLGITEAAVLGCDVNVLGGSYAQSKNVLEHMNAAWDHTGAPRAMLADVTSVQHTLTNSARIRPLTASQKTVRGPHPPRLILDEIDEMDQDILNAAFGQPLPRNNWLGVEIDPGTLMVSTWQRADGPMVNEMKRMNEAGLPVMTYCYRENMKDNGGWLDPRTVDQKRLEIPKAMWEIEFELGEPSIGNRAFDSDSVDRMFDVKPPTPIKHTSYHREYRMLSPRDDRDYVIAADWAQTQDWTVITVFDVSERPIRMAYYLKIQRHPYPHMVGLYNNLQERYNAEGIHDATGLGSVVSDLITNTRQTENFIMAGRQRDDMLSDFVSAVESDQIRAPKITELRSVVMYASVEDLYSRGKDYHLPDEICSMALAWRLVRGYTPPAKPWSLSKDEEEGEKDETTNLEHTTGGVYRKTQDPAESFSLS